MFCNECGAELPDGSKFCSICGTKMISPQESRQAAQSMQTGYSYDGQSNYDPSYQQEMHPNYSQSYQQEMQSNYSQSYQQEMQSGYVQQPQPDDNKKTNSKIASKKKLPIWEKALITVCALAVVGVETFLTIHFIKGKKNGKPAYITINGVKCEFNDKDGISNLDEIENGVLLQNDGSYDLYQNGELVKTLEPDEKFSVFVKKEVLNIHEEKERNAGVSVHLNNNADFEFSDGINEESSEADLEKAGFVCFSQINNDDERKYTYSKLYDKNGEISVESINSDYNMFLESGFENLNYDLVSYGFPDDKNNFDFSRDKETNRKVLKNRYQNMDIKDYDTFLKFRLLVCREFGKLTGMNAHEYIGSTKDYLVRVDLVYINGKYNDATISIYGPMENLNEYMNNWGVPDFSMFILDAKITTEHYDTQEDATIEIYDPYIEIRPGADLPEDEDYNSQQPVEPWEISVSDIPEYDALISFLLSFEWYYDNDWGDEYDEYDSSKAADGTSNILGNIMGNPMCIQRIGLYDDVYDLEEAWIYGGDPADPRGYTNDPDTEWVAYHSLSENGLRWIANNIFNVSDGDFEALTNDLEVRGRGYYESGRYYYSIEIAGEGLAFYPEIESVKTNGRKYIITYYEMPDPNFFGDTASDIPSKKYIAEMELKNIDGKNYWSMYYKHKAE
ncbi:MAG: zinc ribbon domain-containing protein [Lachnospiraceae bacterium]|nr:zinc ribbon domain-containing protein [Lachnospiraceae bacterium]